MSSGPATARLAELEAAVKESEARLADVERERAGVVRELARAAAPLTGYYEAVGAGEREPDLALEAKLTEQVRESRSTATLRLNNAPDDPSRITGAHWVDDRVEAKMAGATRALTERRDELIAFLRDNGELVAEWIAEGAEVRDEAAARWRDVQAALRRWQSIAVRWGEFLEANGIDRAEMPPHPLAGLDRDPGRHGIPLPAPASLVEGEAAA